MGWVSMKSLKRNGLIPQLVDKAFEFGLIPKECRNGRKNPVRYDKDAVLNRKHLIMNISGLRKHRARHVRLCIKGRNVIYLCAEGNVDLLVSSLARDKPVKLVNVAPAGPTNNPADHIFRV